jgi:hypothetical protein
MAWAARPAIAPAVPVMSPIGINNKGTAHSASSRPPLSWAACRVAGSCQIARQTSCPQRRAPGERRRTPSARWQSRLRLRRASANVAMSVTRDGGPRRRPGLYAGPGRGVEQVARDQVPPTGPSRFSTPRSSDLPDIPLRVAHDRAPEHRLAVLLRILRRAVSILGAQQGSQQPFGPVRRTIGKSSHRLLVLTSGQ